MLSEKTLRNLPKGEIHRHLEGGVRFETIVDLAKYYNLDLNLSSNEELKSKVKITSPMSELSEVIESFGTTQKVLCSYEAIRRVTFENVEDSYRDGVKLLELRFAPAFISAGKDLDNDEIIEGVLDGISSGMEEYPIQVGLIGILPRTFDLEVNQRATAELLRYAQGSHTNADRICGFDLADDEEKVPPEEFIPFVDKARQAGLGITVHTGENTNALCVEKTLRLFKADRIGHGIKIWGDESIMDMVKNENIMLEICPTSNWLTNSVSSLEEHPLPHLYRNGIAVSINSDDPHLMDIDLVHEYEICERYYHFELEDFYRINRDTIHNSFLPEEIRNYVLAKFF